MNILKYSIQGMSLNLTLFRTGFLGSAHRWEADTYPTIMKLGTVIPYLKKFQKLYESRDTPFEFCWNQHFFPEISKFCYIKKYRYRFHLDTYFLTLLTFLKSLRIVLINMVNIFMMSEKMATPGLLKIKIFWKKAYYVIIFAHDVTKTILSRDSNYKAWLLLHFYERSYHTVNFMRIWPEKLLFWGVVLVQAQ